MQSFVSKFCNSNQISTLFCKLLKIFQKFFHTRPAKLLAKTQRFHVYSLRILFCPDQKPHFYEADTGADSFKTLQRKRARERSFKQIAQKKPTLPCSTRKKPAVSCETAGFSDTTACPPKHGRRSATALRFLSDIFEKDSCFPQIICRTHHKRRHICQPSALRRTACRTAADDQRRTAPLVGVIRAKHHMREAFF